MVDRSQITGLVLAGGQGSRMGGADKGLLQLNGEALASIALRRLGPQVGPLMISVNRHLDVYRAFGVPLCTDESTDLHEGPLAGFLSALRHCDTPYLVTVPCDCPWFPIDLVQQLMGALTAAEADIAMAAARHNTTIQREPAFCLMKRELANSLTQFMHTGQRSIERWSCGLRRTEAVFDNPSSFVNINTPEDLEQYGAHRADPR